MVSRCADGRGRTAPREIIHLLNSLGEQEVARVERGGSISQDDTLFDRAVFKTALAAVSSARLAGTLYAEYSDLKPFVAKLEGQKTEQTAESLRSIWGAPEGESERMVQELVDVGFPKEDLSSGRHLLGAILISGRASHEPRFGRLGRNESPDYFWLELSGGRAPLATHCW